LNDNSNCSTYPPTPTPSPPPPPPLKCTLIHCRAGRSRSAAMTIAYAMRKHMCTLQEAHDYVSSRRRGLKLNLV
jgi:hypothetical protein